MGQDVSWQYAGDADDDEVDLNPRTYGRFWARWELDSAVTELRSAGAILESLEISARQMCEEKTSMAIFGVSTILDNAVDRLERLDQEEEGGE